MVYRAWLCGALLMWGLLPVWSNMPVYVSEKGSLLPVVISKLSFQDLSLSEALQLLSGRTGLLYGIAYSENAPELVARRSVNLTAATSLLDVLHLLEKTYPEYKFNITDHSVEALPKHLEWYRMGWLTDKAFDFSVKGVEPIVAAEQFCGREDVVKTGMHALPLAHPGRGFLGRGMVDGDGDTLLVSRTYQQATPRAILSSLAFSSGQSWALCFPRPNPITGDHAILWMQTCVDTSPSPALHITLPKGFQVRYAWTRHYFTDYAQIKIRKFHSEQRSIVEAFDRLCLELGLHYTLALPNETLLQPRTLDFHDTDLLTLLHNLFGLRGYAYTAFGTTGMLVITPREEAGKSLPLLRSLQTPLQHGGSFAVDWTTALPTVNAYLKAQLPEAPCTVDAGRDLSKASPFTYRVPWDGEPLTALQLLGGLARKVDSSVLIVEHDHTLAATVSPLFPHETEFPFVLVVSEPGEHNPY